MDSFSFTGCRGARQDSAAVATLLHGNTGPYLCGGQRGQRQNRRSATGTTPYHKRQRDAWCHHSCVC